MTLRILQSKHITPPNSPFSRGGLKEDVEKVDQTISAEGESGKRKWDFRDFGKKKIQHGIALLRLDLNCQCRFGYDKNEVKQKKVINETCPGLFTEGRDRRNLNLFHTVLTSQRTISVTSTASYHEALKQSHNWWCMLSKLPVSMMFAW